MDIDSSHPMYGEIINLFERNLRGDEFIRRDRMRQWVRCHSFWDGLQYTFWDELSSNWRLPPEDILESLPRVLNYYRGHGESIVAALSTSVPYVRFYPDDADDPFDVETAKAYSKLAELIQSHNNGKLLAVKALFTMYNEDYVCAMLRVDKNAKYGSVYVPQFQEQQVQRDNPVCPECGLILHGVNDSCPNCGAPAVNEPFDDTEFILESYREQPIAKTKIDILGALFVKIPYYVRCFEDITYVIKSQEYHYSKLRECYPAFRKYIEPGVDVSRYDAWGRMEYKFYMEADLTTLHQMWIRPCQFEMVEEDDARDDLKKFFPKGLKVDILGSNANYRIVDLEDCCMDDDWEINYTGTSLYMHGMPIGQGYIPVQEMQNELANLTIQTIEYGIPETFVDPQVLDLEKYGQREALPGMLTNAEAPPGKSLGDGFFTIKAATLGDDVEPFAGYLEQAGQFITGDYPSVSGSGGEGSKTYGEYALSHTQALQRLGLFWGAYNWFWAQTMFKAVSKHVKAMIDGEFDEKYVDRNGQAFIQTWIRRVQLQGKVGRVEPESSDKLPISAAQKMDVLFKLIELNNPDINSVIYSPENSEFIAESLGYPDIKIPGEVQRQKQFEEIRELLVSEPQMDMMGGFEPSVQIEPQIDDDQAHIDVLKTFLAQHWTSLRTENPGGYLNCMAHLQKHTENLQMQQMAMMAPPPGGAPNEESNAPAEESVPAG